MIVYVLVIYGKVVGAFSTWAAADACRKRSYDQDEYRLYECQVRDR